MLQNLGAYMAWVPVECYMDHDTMALLFGIIRQHGQHSVAALGCMLELLMRKYAPTAGAPMVAQAFIEAP